MDHDKENGLTIKGKYSYLRSCIECGEVYSSKKSFSKYCSSSCKSAHYKKQNAKVAVIRKIQKGRNFSKEVSENLKIWTDVSHLNIETIIENADPNETLRKLNELGYNENLPQKEISFSFDGRLLIWKNILGKYHILKKDSVQ